VGAVDDDGGAVSGPCFICFGVGRKRPDMAFRGRGKEDDSLTGGDRVWEKVCLERPTMGLQIT